MVPAMPSTTPCDVCPHCGRPYRTIEIPAFLGIPSRTIQSSECDCPGAVAERRRIKREERQDALRKAWAATGVPERYKDVNPDYDALERIESTGKGLYICGPRGTGKTNEACAVLKAYVSRHTRDDGWCSARFVSVAEWLDKIQDTYGNRASAEDVFAKASGPRFLVLDDMGKVNSRITDWTVGKLFRLVDERYNAKKLTVITSQYRLSGLSERLTAGNDRDTPDAIVSRLFEMCAQERMDGADRRIA